MVGGLGEGVGGGLLRKRRFENLCHDSVNFFVGSTFTQKDLQYENTSIQLY